MGIEHRFPRRLVFLVLQQPFQLGIFAAPGGVFGIKGLGHSTPAYIAGQDFLLLWSGISPFCLQ